MNFTLYETNVDLSSNYGSLSDKLIGYIPTDTILLISIIFFILFLGFFALYYLYMSNTKKENEGSVIVGFVASVIILWISITMFSGVSNVDNYQDTSFWINFSFKCILFLISSFFSVYCLYDFYSRKDHEFKAINGKYIQKFVNIFDEGLTALIFMFLLASSLLFSAFLFIFSFVTAFYLILFFNTDLWDSNFTLSYDSYLGFLSSVATVLYVLLTGVSLFHLHTQNKNQQKQLEKTQNQLNNQEQELRNTNYLTSINFYKDQINNYYYPIHTKLIEFKETIELMIEKLDSKDNNYPYIDKFKEIVEIEKYLSNLTLRYSYLDDVDFINIYNETLIHFTSADFNIMAANDPSKFNDDERYNIVGSFMKNILRSVNQLIDVNKTNLKQKNNFIKEKNHLLEINYLDNQNVDKNDVS